jgi:hypothetical protein
MAKVKTKKSGGPGTGIILTLIFFVLTTFIGVTVAYNALGEVAAADKKAADAKAAEQKMQTQMREERARKILLKMSQGLETPEERVTFSSELENFKPAIMEEYDNLLIELKDKTPEPFLWPLLTTKTAKEIEDLTKDPDLVRTDKDTIMGLRPTKLLSVMAAEWKKKYDTDVKRGRDIDSLVKDVANAVKTTQAAQGNDEAIFRKDIENLKQVTKDNYAKVDAEFQKLKKERAKDGDDSKKLIADKGKLVLELEDALAKANAELADQKRKLAKYETEERRLDAVAIDLLIKEEAKGRIVSKEENDFVTIDIGSNRKLKPQVRFLVIASGVSWMSLEEKEVSLKRFTLSNDRQPYEDNPYVKAAIEVVEILGPERARCKILFENNRIRNPVQVQDQVFNVAWQPEEQIRVAFAGIIDLDGDGIDNNQEFLTQLERHGVVVDEYLKLNPLDFAKRDGRGMSLQTKYLIIADDPRFEGLQLDPNSPQRKYVEAVLGKMSDIKLRARQLGVQLVDARKFVSLMGYKLPKNPAPLQYGSSVYWGAAANMGMPMMPPNN